MAKDTEVRTYNVRDGKGYLDYSTDDLGDLLEHVDGRTGKFSIDDHDLKDLRKLAEAQAKEAKRATAEAVKAGKERHRLVQARVKELEDPKVLARAIAELEHDAGRLNEDG